MDGTDDPAFDAPILPCGCVVRDLDMYTICDAGSVTGINFAAPA